MVEAVPKFVWGELPPSNSLTTALPFLVKLSVVNESKDLMVDYQGNVQVSALTCKVCLAEGFESRRLGLWCVWPPSQLLTPRAAAFGDAPASLWPTLCPCPAPLPQAAGVPSGPLRARLRLGDRGAQLDT